MPIPVTFDRLVLAAALACLPAACSSGPGMPGGRNDDQPYSGIAPDEILRLAGTEPFWGGNVTGGTFTYTTPEAPGGLAIRVERFAGRNGVSFNGEMDGKSVSVAVSPGSCSDGMSDRVYPFSVTLMIAGGIRNGCAWSDVHPFTGPKAP